MELRHLKYFLAIAEELHFSRAATRLGISQPPLSQQIRQLELELGARLFRRLPRGVELTAPGETLLVEARRILGQAEQAKRLVKQAAQGEVGAIRVGLSGSTTFNPVIPDIIRRFRDAYPMIDLRLEETNSASLIKRMLDDEFDVAFVLQPLDRGDRLVFRPVATDEVLLALPAGHRLAEPGDIDLAALATETLILVPREVGPGYHDLVIAACREAGFSPGLGQPSQRMSSAIHFVAAGLGIAIVPGWLARMGTEGVVYRRLAAPVPRVTIELVHRRGAVSAVVANFIDVSMRTATLGGRTT